MKTFLVSLERFTVKQKNIQSSNKGQKDVALALNIVPAPRKNYRFFWNAMVRKIHKLSSMSGVILFLKSKFPERTVPEYLTIFAVAAILVYVFTE